MRDFRLLVLTPRERVYDGDITSLVMPTADGEIGFLAGREETVLEVLPGDLRLRAGKKDTVLETDGGVAHMTGKKLTVLCGVAYPKEVAKEMRARRASELSEERKKQEKSLADYKLTRAALMRAFDKLKRTEVK